MIVFRLYKKCIKGFISTVLYPRHSLWALRGFSDLPSMIINNVVEGLQNILTPHFFFYTSVMFSRRLRFI